jgi:hypothetical protein
MADRHHCTSCNRPVVGCVCLLSALDSMRAHHAVMMRERDAAYACADEWERAYQGALADEKRAREEIRSLHWLREQDRAQVRRAALEEAARLVADWPGIPSQQDVADAIRDLAEKP